ncbi:DUF1294 domain-containing protein [Dokdonella sp.]|uniref:DUF1294 domain-containing protein n=1 Tax=Dokdonella sp. TaxID=2291710 RepID=UPI003C44237A
MPDPPRCLTERMVPTVEGSQLAATSLARHNLNFQPHHADAMPMRLVGRIFDWKDEKGFGFVEPNGGGERAFVHVNAFEKRGRRPVEGDLISYETSKDDRRRLNATRIRYVRNAGDKSAASRVGFPRRSLGVIALLTLAMAAYLGKLPVVAAVFYAGMSTITFLAYGLDKSAARADGQRTAESTLHLLELLGGWPGALIAQGSFRHKTRKRSYQVTFWLVVVINLALLAWLIHSGHMESLVRQLQRFW